MLIYFLHFMIYIIGVYFWLGNTIPIYHPSIPGPARNIHAHMNSF